MKIPTRQECINLLDEFNVPEHIKKHSFAVNKIAVFLAEKLKRAGEDVNIELVDAASLLHDIDKIKTIKDKYGHGDVAEEWLSERGHSRVGEVVRKHTLHHLTESRNNSWEDKIVQYADQRCNDDKIVSLKERHDYVITQYNSYFKEEYRKKILDIEKEIFSRISIKPEELKDEIQNR